jgi:magnesium-transporting ATPase (P-type)
MSTPGTPLNEAGFPVPAELPLTFGQILDRTFRLLWRNFLTLLLIALPPTAILVLLVGALEGAVFLPFLRNPARPPDPTLMFSGWMLLAMIGISIVCVVLYSLYLPATLHASLELQEGRPVSFGGAYSKAASIFGRFVLLHLWVYCIACLPLLLCEAPVFFTPMLSKGDPSNTIPLTLMFLPIWMLLALAAMVYSFYMMLRYSMAFPACVAEGLTARAALRRSITLTAKAKGRIFLILLVVYAVCYAAMLASMMIVFIFTGVSLFVGSLAHLPSQFPGNLVYIVPAALLGVIFLLVWMALPYMSLTTALAVLYRDQTRRLSAVS